MFATAVQRRSFAAPTSEAISDQGMMENVMAANSLIRVELLVMCYLCAGKARVNSGCS